jgi:TatD DNase family protein
MRGVVHCFTGNTEQARTYVEEFGLLLGIGGVVTFKTAQPLRDAVRAVGLGPIVLETDCPYLAPVPYRGKRNEPAFIAESARTVARVVEVPVDDVLATTDANARRLFALV